ncbi:FISUMP domain-containing protein [Calditrichota bacterium]
MQTKIITITLLTILTTIAIFIACEKKPTQPEHTNVYDPNNPASSGDPFQLQVSIGNGGVTLTWTKPASANLAVFNIYRSENEITGYAVLSSVSATITQYVDQGAQNGHSYWYRIAAEDGNGNETSISNVSSMNIKTDPVLVINSGDLYTPTKEVNLTILANTAQQMIISNLSDFSDANWESYTTSKNWTLLIGEGEKIIYMKIKYNDGTETLAISDTISPQPFEPSIIINDGDDYTPTKQVTLQLAAIGATEMNISNSSFSQPEGTFVNGLGLVKQEQRELKNEKKVREIAKIKKYNKTKADFEEKIKVNENWEPFGENKNWELNVGDGTKTVYSKFKNDFEIESEVVFDDIAPLSINPSISIAGGAQYTASRNTDVTLSANGISLEMKLSEDSTFTGVNWQPYLTQINFQLSIGEGIKRVYTIYKNDFEIESEIVFDDIEPQPIEPSINIANGEKYVPSPNVELILSASGLNLAMKLSEDSTFSGINWQAFNSQVNFQLSTGEGQKKVFAIFKNDFEIESAVIRDSILLDTTPPVAVLVATPDSGITDETNFQFDPTASNDNLAPLSDMLVRFDWENDGNYDTGWQQLSVIGYQYSIGGGDKTVKMEIQDGAGWNSDTAANIFVNTRPAASFTATEDTINLLLFHFDASASSDYENGRHMQYRWDFDGDDVWDTNWLVKDTISYNFTYSGLYSSKLSVSDLNNLQSEKSIQVAVGCIDIDGNIYNVVKIGTQWWMAENLKTNSYRNGDNVPNIINNSQWGNTTSGAYCNYNNDVNNSETYGLLYNWYAANDSRGLAPAGWHVPTDEEWKQLEMFLGMSQSQADATEWRGTDEGGKMKTTGTIQGGDGLWESPNTGATNSSGFSALPGGDRGDFLGNNFHWIGYYGFWWSSGSSAWKRHVNYEYSQVFRLTSDKRYGYSIRCVRD